jgi:ketosteroid isomerase-like protein
MTAEKTDATAIVTAFYGAAGTADFDTVRTLLDPDVVLTEPDSVPYAGVYRGRDAVVDAVYTKYYDFTHSEINYIVSDGANAVARLEVAGKTHTTGKPVAFSATECFGIRDGKITSIHSYHFDTVQIAEAFSAD